MELDPFSRARLEWLFDNEPETVRELARSDIARLEELVENAVISAIQYAERLQGEGMERQESYHLAS